MQPIEVAQAIQLIHQHALPVGITSLTLPLALNQVLAADVFASFDHPPFDQSLRDGVAFSSQTDPSAPLQLVDTVFAGQMPNVQIQSGQAVRIMTGAPLPIGSDCVQMIENVTWHHQLSPPSTLSETTGDHAEQALPSQTPSCWTQAQSATHVTLNQTPKPQQFVLGKGAVFSRGEVLIQSGTRLNAQHIGLLASANIQHVECRSRPRISILVTGDEIVNAGEALKPGQIYNSNGPMLRALAQSLDLDTVDVAEIKDQPDQLDSWIAQQIDGASPKGPVDIIVTTGGVSAGQKDEVPAVFERLKIKKVFHGVRMKPGKPVWFGYFDQPPINIGSQSTSHRTYVLGLPGNPVSSFVTFSIFAKQLVQQILGSSQPPQWTVGTLSEDLNIGGGRGTFWPGIIEWHSMSNARTPEEDSLIVKPLPWLGSPDLRSPSNANCLIFHDPSQNVDKDPASPKRGQHVQILLL